MRTTAAAPFAPPPAPAPIPRPAPPLAFAGGAPAPDRRLDDARSARAGMPLRVAIIEPDPAARQHLVRLFDGVAGAEVVAASECCADVPVLAARVSPDAMFIAVRDHGAEMVPALAALARDRRPALILVADREEYAYQAFEIEAADYLVAPVGPERLARALARVRERLVRTADLQRFHQLVDASSGRAGRAGRLIVKSPGDLTFVNLDEIDWIEAAGNYVRVHVGVEAYLVRESVKNVERRLDGRFLRVHRSAIVNTDRIKRISMDESGHPWVVLKDGTRISAGRYIEGQLREWMDSAC
jgi:two-component system LytT family response regulator